MRRQVALAEQVEGEVGGLAGDVVARDALAVADRAVGQGAADDEVVGLGAGVGGVGDLAPHRDADVPGLQFDDAHQATSGGFGVSPFASRASAVMASAIAR